MFLSTLFSKFKEEFKYGRVNPDEHYDKFIFIIPQTDRKDAHNLMRGSIALRIGQVPRDVIIECNGGKVFDVSDIDSTNSDVKAKARICIGKIMEYVNRCCDEGLKKNFLCRSFKTNGNSVNGASAFAKSSKRAKLSY